MRHSRDACMGKKLETVLTAEVASIPSPTLSARRLSTPSGILAVKWERHRREEIDTRYVVRLYVPWLAWSYALWGCISDGHPWLTIAALGAVPAAVLRWP
jgi:hypothetical protein